MYLLSYRHGFMTTSPIISRKFYFLILWTLLTSLCFDAYATDFYVSPSGDDKANGLTTTPIAASEGPFRTIGRAQQAIRALKQNNSFNQAITVHLQNGVFELTDPLKFDARDSGTQDKPITWQGSSESPAILSGGKSLSCKQTTPAQFDCPADEITSRPGNPSSPERTDAIFPDFRVFIKDTKLKVARWPNNGWAHIKQGITQNTVYSVMESLPDLKSDVANAQAHIFSSVGWYDEYIDISSIDSQINSILLKNKTKYPFSSGRQFLIQNHQALLDSPGEWFYNPTHKTISVIPPSGMNGEAITVTNAPNILSINGASHIKFKNIELKYSRDTAIYANKTHYLDFDNLTIKYVGTKAIDIYESDNIQIHNNKIHDTGSGGVYINGGDLPLLKSSKNIIENNHFYGISNDILTAHPAILVSGVGATVRHNLVEQSSNLGIMIYGNNHTIEKNELHHVCMECADCGGVYASNNWAIRGNIIRHNYIHDIMGYGLDHVNQQLTEAIYTSPREGRGIYIDNAASGFEIIGNILVNPGEIGIHINGGRDNKIMGNYISTNNSAIVILNREKYMEWDLLQSKLAESPYKNKVWTKAYPELAKSMNKYFWPENNTVSGNVLVKSGTSANLAFLRYDLPDDAATISQNIVWSTGEPVNIRYELLGKTPATVLDWRDWNSQRLETNSIFADPCISLNGKSIASCPNSPISQIGFQPIPSDIGLLNP